MPNLKLYVEWDVVTWARALRFWQKHIPADKFGADQICLEIGAHNGGLSLFFATRYGWRVVCSDYHFPENARRSHESFKLNHLIEYQAVDATKIPFPDATFDFVVFKSVLGVIGTKGDVPRIERAILEIHRVLKPGGIMLFAENAHASTIHRLARNKFVRWGKKWHYLSPAETEALLLPFKKRVIHSTGFLAAFIVRPESLKNLIAWLDQWLLFIPSRWRYVIYGYAQK